MMCGERQRSRGQIVNCCNISIALTDPGGADFGWENRRTIQRTMSAEYQPFTPIVRKESAWK